MLGYAIISNSTLTLIAWSLWSTWFVLAPFAEEPWLRERFGARYEAYAARIPRFLPGRQVKNFLDGPC
jgi:protein-S-isoprenylcysteine O-methyltransferase Ste14